MWTQFMDMHSGGGQKLDWAYIYIEAPKEEAMVIFQNRFGRSPHRVTCTCCGEDYSVNESGTLPRVTAYERGCRWIINTPGWATNSKGKYIERDKPIPDGWYEDSTPCHDYKTLAQYKQDKHILIIPKEEIKPEERKGELQEEGYVWKE